MAACTPVTAAKLPCANSNNRVASAAVRIASPTLLADWPTRLKARTAAASPTTEILAVSSATVITCLQTMHLSSRPVVFLSPVQS